MPVKRPIGRNNLDKALHRLFRDDTATEAVDWANELVRKIDESEEA